MRKIHNSLFIIHYSSNGFSLIELIVAIAIMTVVSSLGIASYISFSRSQVLTTAVSDVRIMIETARARAKSQIKPASCTNSLEGYKAVLGHSDFISKSAEASNRTYQFSAQCGGNQFDPKVAELPSGFSFNGVVTTLTFRILGKGVDEAISSGTQIVITSGSQSKTIKVYPDARIEVQ